MVSLSTPRTLIPADPDPSKGEEGAPFVMFWELTCELGHKSDLWHMINLSNMYDDGNLWAEYCTLRRLVARYCDDVPTDDGDEDDDGSEQHDGRSPAEM